MEDWVNLSRKVIRRNKTEKSTQFWTPFLLFLGVFGEYSLIGDGLCCRLRDLGVLLVWVMYLQRSSWPIKSCGTLVTYTLHKPTRRRFPRRRVVVYGIDYQWKADLVHLTKLSSYNKGFKYLLTCIDVLSRYPWVVPLTDKTIVV
jgi:hypothetical protein